MRMDKMGKKIAMAMENKKDANKRQRTLTID